MYIFTLLSLSVPSIILYICSWRTKNKILQIIFSILTIISPVIILIFLYIDVAHSLFASYLPLIVFIPIYAFIKIIIFEKSKKLLPIIPIVTGIIFSIPFIMIIIPWISSFINFIIPSSFNGILRWIFSFATFGM